MTRRKPPLPPAPPGSQYCRHCRTLAQIEEYGWNAEKGAWYRLCTACRFRMGEAANRVLAKREGERLFVDQSWRAAWVALGLPLVAKRGNDGRGGKQA